MAHECHNIFFLFFTCGPSVPLTDLYIIVCTGFTGLFSASTTPGLMADIGVRRRHNIFLFVTCSMHKNPHKTQEMALKRLYFSKFSWGAWPQPPLEVLVPLA